jgi:DNA repair photolyase/predicted SprT family Zn-dependent metalloprotease
MAISDALQSRQLEHSEVLLQHPLVDATPKETTFKGINWIENKTILTPTSGFLASGYTHTLNPYVGCGFAGALCGTFCYAQHQHWIVRGRPWGFYGAKQDIRQAYQRDYDRIKRLRQVNPRPLRIYMASSTDPYVPQEKQLGLTRAILEEMQIRPPDVLVIQTHTTLIIRDLDLIQPLSKQCELWVSITCETDMDPVPGFPPHASRPAKRLETLKRFREAGVSTQATISPLMPLADPETFARALDAACDRVILDHYLLGDGTHGARTRRTNFLELLEQAGFGEWSRIEKMWEVRDLLAGVLGPERVLVSAEGFNAVGSARTPAIHITQDDRNSMSSPLDAPQSPQSCTDTATSDLPAENVPILRLNQKKDAPRDVYEMLRDHQQTTSENLRLLHTYLPLIIKRFYGDELPLPALSWASDRNGTLGWYLEKDGLALNHRINLNSMYTNRPLAEVLRTLTHELGHCFQHVHGKPGRARKSNYHNKEFQLKMQEIGIPCNKRGVSLGMQEPFVSFLKELGIEAEIFLFKQENDELPARPGSRLKPWSCGCTRVWASSGTVAVAACLKCGKLFQPQSNHLPIEIIERLRELQKFIDEESNPQVQTTSINHEVTTNG